MDSPKLSHACFEYKERDELSITTLKLTFYFENYTVFNVQDAFKSLSTTTKFLFDMLN